MQEMMKTPETEKRMAGNYEITHSLRIGDREVVFGTDPASENPYFCALCHKRFEIIQVREIYERCAVSDSYIEAAEQFAAYVQEQCQKVRAEWDKVTVPRICITEEMCFPRDNGRDITGRVAAVRPSVLWPEYRSADQQLFLVTGGAGAAANSRGTSCFGVNLYTGENVCWRRHEVLGEVRPECLPEWAQERAAGIRQRLTVHKQSRSRGQMER